MRRLGQAILGVLLVTALAWTGAAYGGGIRVDVVGGKHDVTDWVAEVTLDLAVAAKLLGNEGRPDRVVVHERTSVASGAMVPQQVAEGVWVQATDKTSGTSTILVPFQVDKDAQSDLYTIAWRIPGELSAGARRRFLISFAPGSFPAPGDSPGTPSREKGPIRVESDENTATVTNGDIVLQHDHNIGGMISSVTVAGARGDLAWNDKVYDGTEYFLAKHPAKRMDVVARGPLRSTIEVESKYLDAGNSPSSNVRAVYRFTSYAGLPFTIVEGLVMQDFAHQWRSNMFIEILTDGAGLTHYWTDEAGNGEMQHNSTTHDGHEWAAVYHDKLLIAACASVNPFVHDGPPEGYPSYLQSGRTPVSDLRRPWRGALIWGAGPKTVEEGVVQRWSQVLADPPKVSVVFAPLGDRVADLERALREKQDALDSLSGQAWSKAHVGLTVGQVQAAVARESALAGRFGEALEAIEACVEALADEGGEVELTQKGTIQAGLVHGYPYLANDMAAFVFAKPQDGAGLVSIFDRESGWEFLKMDPKRAPLWRISTKRRQSGSGYESVGTACDVTVDADEEEGRLRFRWSKGLAVEVEARLPAGESLLRARLRAKTTDRSSGLVMVHFPVIEKIKPLTPGGRQDKVIETWGLGGELPSPLVSGKVAYGRSPAGMQFTALHADGLGLYIAEEDGQVHVKERTWTPDSSSQTLDFSSSHPVKNWAAKQLVREYESPGDIVLGPFHGDWYDTARIYRKWALTAPWCAKGPVYERDDYPQWLAKAPYWIIEGMSNEGEARRIMRSHEFYEVPVTVNHTVSWWFSRHQTNREPEYFPPKLGSKGFKQTVAELHEKGVRIVCSTNAWNWDQDTESWLTKDARKSAMLHSSGEIFVSGGISKRGHSMVSMCPASQLWRQTMADVSTELVGRYGVAGIYYDYLTFNVSDCHNEAHGHTIGGGDYWSKSVHDFYELMRTECRKLNPEVIFTGEGAGEFCIDVLDTFLVSGQSNRLPLLLAVYHGYTNVYGGEINKVHSPVLVGRRWLWGTQNGWNNMEYRLTTRPLGKYYKTLLKCRWDFGTPYLGYGEMLRPPRVEGDLPEMAAVGERGPFTAPAVEGAAWKAPDGTVGVFFLNYDDKPHDFTWSVDLAETGIDASRKLKVSRWRLEEGLEHLKEIHGGVVQETMSIEPWGLIALKMEVKP